MNKTIDIFECVFRHPRLTAWFLFDVLKENVREFCNKHEVVVLVVAIVLYILLFSPSNLFRFVN